MRRIRLKTGAIIGVISNQQLSDSIKPKQCTTKRDVVLIAHLDSTFTIVRILVNEGQAFGVLHQHGKITRILHI
jgi:hypothetical protein